MNNNTEEVWDERYDGFGQTPHKVMERLKGHSPLYDFMRSKIELFLKAFPDAKILDIGCGPGTLGMYCDNNQAYYVGVDFSNSAMDGFWRAFPENTRFAFHRFDISKDWKRLAGMGKFDLVLSCEFLEHIENDQEVLSIIPSLLNPNGRALISVPTSNKHHLHLRGYTEDMLRMNWVKQDFFTLGEGRWIATIAKLESFNESYYRDVQ